MASFAFFLLSWDWNQNFLKQAACLPCAGLTAWNGLNGLNALGKSHTVVVQGTGGVSMMALKLAASSGADLILTSSSDAKLEQVKTLYGLGSIKTINYKTCPRWEEEVLRLTHNAGVDITIENGGG
ncbi:alcohol dehydrogenase [Cladophialophora psammophila CBS 110553]|uniref:Alcohol dehydrogenase n=1 Tax=Cladophialophora psammophila CBS 110553 TaxID=1182543 RepID=W9WCF6_9EURO|nr:alcohol dehydrogenase [Cladophialophora psammophila CBS 110553]EXJ65643.1 alcohol dehydrogenase [Cladophialophora psammophila CBS 110553]